MNDDQKKKIKEFNVQKFALNKEKLGSLTFDDAYKYFEELQKLFIELIDLDYENKLTPEEVRNINVHGIQFINNHLSRLENYDINQNNAKELHDNIINEVRNFYNSLAQVYRSALVYLRQESGLENKNAKDLQEAQKDVLASKKEYEKLINNLTSKIKELEKKETEVEIKHGEVASVLLAKYFEKQSTVHNTNADLWLESRNKFFKWIIIILAVNFILYFCIFFANKFGWIELETKNIFTIEYGIIKLALLSVLSYGLAFCSKNYRIESNLKSVNTHRKNVAQTLDDFLATNPGADTKSQMIKQGTEAMFKHLPLGYISNEDSRDVGPVNEIIYKITDSVKK
jgi:hypothetical protein